MPVCLWHRSGENHGSDEDGYGVAASLGGQHLAALGTAASKNLTAVLGGHAGTETMHHGALTFFGMIGLIHKIFSFRLLTGQSPPLSGGGAPNT